MNNDNIYQFNATQLNGDQLSLQSYQNKVLLIVNTASQCGFTPQLTDLVELKKAYDTQDFEILAFPSNDFGGQEPLDGDEIALFCERYETNFPVFEKIRVRGPYADPLYQFLADKNLNGTVKAAPRWNFHKYLIDKQGKVVDFFYPFTKPGSAKVKKKIAQLLSQQ
jgi:glutathione peroxidase